MVLQSCQDLLLLLGLSFLAHREDFERKLVEIRPHRTGVVIGNDDRNVDSELPPPMPLQEIRQAMI